MNTATPRAHTADYARLRDLLDAVTECFPPEARDRATTLIDLASIEPLTQKIGSACFVTRNDATIKGLLMVREGDVLLALHPQRAPIVSVVTKGFANCAVTFDFVVLRAKPERMLPRFLAHMLLSPAIRRQLADIPSNHLRRADEELHDLVRAFPDLQYELFSAVRMQEYIHKRQRRVALEKEVLRLSVRVPDLDEQRGLIKRMDQQEQRRLKSLQRFGVENDKLNALRSDALRGTVAP